MVSLLPAFVQLGTLKFIWRSEGTLGLYKGMGTQMFKAVVASALMLMWKEKIQQLFAASPPPPPPDDKKNL